MERENCHGSVADLKSMERMRSSHIEEVIKKSAENKLVEGNIHSEAYGKLGCIY